MSLQGKVTLIRRWVGIALGKNRVAIEQGVGKYYAKDGVAGYYNDLTGKVNDKTLLDNEGIAVNMIKDNKTVYFPISIFQYALGIWDLYLVDKNNDLLSRFLKHCEWIIVNQEENGSWDCFGPIGYTNYSVSSMGQGEAISVLIRSYSISGKQRWLTAIEKAMTFMITELEDGGTLLVIGEDYYFEEYPDIDGAKRGVLNGWIFSLFGIYDYLKVFDDNEIKNIFNKSVQTLKRHLYEYDSGYWSYYDRTGRLSSPSYHELHIALLIVLSDLTNDKYFAKTAEKWKQYSDRKINRVHAITKKAVQKLKENPEGIVIQ